MAFGEFINLFYSTLVKDLSFFQYIPLIIGVTVIGVPSLLYVISLLSLVLFGYEFNFFHLISFRKSQQPQAVPVLAEPDNLENENQHLKDEIKMLTTKLQAIETTINTKKMFKWHSKPRTKR